MGDYHKIIIFVTIFITLYYHNFIKIEVEKMKKMAKNDYLPWKKWKMAKKWQKFIMQKKIFFLVQKTHRGAMVIKWHFFKKTSILPCKKWHFWRRNIILRNGYYHRKKRDLFCVMILDIQKKILCKKSSKIHVHMFSHVNHYDDFLARKK